MFSIIMEYPLNTCARKRLSFLYILSNILSHTHSHSSAGQLIYTNREHKKPVLSLVLKGNILASGTSNGRIFLTDIVSGQQLNKVQGHDGSVTALAAEIVKG